MSDFEINFEYEKNSRCQNNIRGCLRNDLRWSGKGGVRRNWKNTGCLIPLWQTLESCIYNPNWLLNQSPKHVGFFFDITPMVWLFFHFKLLFLSILPKFQLVTVKPKLFSTFLLRKFDIKHQYIYFFRFLIFCFKFMYLGKY